MSKITNRRKVVNEGPDFYPTPSWATEALVKYEPLQGTIWEPACGNGAMVKVLLNSGYDVLATDLNEHGFGKSGIDFLQTNTSVDNIITNPPFNIAEDFVEHGLKLANKKLILLLRLAFLESVSRFNNIYAKSPPSRVWVFSQRLSMYPATSIKANGGTTSYGWFVWDKEVDNKETLLKWIPPGHKPKFAKKKLLIDDKKLSDSII